VAVKRLDTWAKDRGVTAVDFIWADIHGAEGDLIVGGRDTLANTHYLYTEYSYDEWCEGQPNLAKLESMLPTFSILRRYPMNVLFENRALIQSQTDHQGRTFSIEIWRAPSSYIIKTPGVTNYVPVDRANGISTATVV
jgi:hypothetical protein